MRTIILHFFLLLAAASLTGQTIKNSSIAVQPTLDNTVPFEFAPQFRYDTTTFRLYAWDDGAWKVIADGAGVTSLSADSVSITDAGGYYDATDVEAGLQEEATKRVALNTLSGVPVTSTDLGTFTGTTIPDNSTNKAAFQALETAVEAGGESYIFSGIAPSTSSLWIDATTHDNCGTFEVKDYFDGWKTVAWYDSVGKVFSPQPPIYAIITGQSNATPRSSGGNNTPSPYTSWWDAGKAAWGAIELPAAWTTGAGNAWWGINFGQEAADVDKRIVKLIYVARGGRPISGWKTGGLEWTEITNRVDSSGIPRIDLVMWYQGESDYARDINDYTADWNTVYSQFQALPEWTNESQILTAQLNTEEPFNLMNGFFNSLSVDTIPLTKTVKNTDTPRSDSQHINAQGYEILGKRMYQTYTGRVEHKPIPQRYEVNNTTTVDFSLVTSIIVQDPDTLLFARNFANGWAGNIKIEDADSSGVVFDFPVVAYAHEGQENISAIYGRFASPCFIDNDTLYLSKLPNYYLSQNTPFTPYDLAVLPHWFRTDTLGSVFGTAGKVDSLRNFGTNYRALIPASGTAPDEIGDINGVNAITFTPTDWLEIDTAGTGSSGIPLGIYDIYMVIETADAKGALMQGNSSAFYYIWDTLSTAGGNAMSVTELYVNDVLVTPADRTTIGQAIIQSTQPVIIQLRQLSYARMSDYFKIMDYGNNLSGFGTSGKFGEMLIAGSLFNRVEELKVTQYLREKWYAQTESNQVFSDVGRQSFRNPQGGENTIGASINQLSDEKLEGSGTDNRVAVWNGTTLDSGPIDFQATTTNFTQSTQVKLPGGTTAERATPEQGDVRINEDTGQFEGSRDGTTWENFLMADLRDWYISDKDTTFTTLPVRSAITFVATSGAAADYTLTIPAPSATYANAELTVYALDQSGSFNIQLTGGANSIRNQLTESTNQALTTGATYTLKCMRVASASYKWVVTSQY